MSIELQSSNNLHWLFSQFSYISRDMRSQIRRMFKFIGFNFTLCKLKVQFFY